jgi:glutaconate CoA-transferase subunit A
VVVEPKACHPSYTQGYYDRDNRFYLDWDAVARDPRSLDAWLNEWVFDLGSHAEYVEKLGDERWAALAPGTAMSGEVNYGEYA